MSTLTVSTRRPLAEVLPRPTTRARAFALDAALIATGAMTVALLAQAEIPLWPVPITGQTLAVVLVGAALGVRRGGLALLTYMLAGLAGLPVFAGFSGSIAALASPSFGFIIGFIPAAMVAGYAAQRAWDRRPLLAFAAFVGASVVPFLVGVPYMAFILNGVMDAGLSFEQILAAGVTPFIVGGVIKAAVAAALIPLAWRGVTALERRRD